MAKVPVQVLRREGRKWGAAGQDTMAIKEFPWHHPSDCGVEKGGKCLEYDDIVMKISENDEETVTGWYFSEECVPWYPRMTSTNRMTPFLDNLTSLCKEGSYCYQLKQWRRYYITREGIVINLVEDVPESGGQNCIWSAGLVMAKYLEFSELRQQLSGQRILELGAGAGLTSMVAALLGGEVYSTEQKSCLGYLQRNVDINPHITIHAHELFWTLSCKENEQFDVILGCDITYDVNNFEAIFHTVKLCLRPSGVFLICHDEESCPLSKRARERLALESSAIGLIMEEIAYNEVVSGNYYHPSVKMWALRYNSTSEG